MDVVAAAESISFSNNSPAWLVLGLAVMAVIYITIRPRRRDPLGGNGPVRFSITQQKALERDMQHVIVELSELTRQMSAQLETRAAKLELLIQDADERIANLQAAVDAAAELPASARPTSARPMPARGDKSALAISQEPSLTTSKPSADAPTLTLADAGDSDVADAIVPAPAQPVRGMRLADDSADRWNEVYARADEGLGVREIARAMNRPHGEIELILALRPKPRKVDATEVAVAVG